MLVFRLVFTLLILLIQFHLYRRFSRTDRSHQQSATRKVLVTAGFALFNLPVIVLFFWRPRLAEWPSWSIIALIYPFYIWHFFSLLTIFGMGIVKFASLLVAAGPKIAAKFKRREQQDPDNKNTGTPEFNPRRREFFRHGFTILAGSTIAGTTYSALRRGNYDISNISIPIRNLPSAFRGFSIALISDIHSSPFMTRSQMEEYVRGVNSLNADLIAIPGDLVNSEIEEAYPFAEAFSELRAPFGVFATLGNHDFFTRNPDMVTRIISDCGVKMLRNELTVLEKAGQQLILAGIDDTGRRDRAAGLMDDVYRGETGSVPRILLCHRPYFFEEASDRNLDLMLSGHTHGGQVVFARFGRNVVAPARFASPYIAGLYSRGDSRMYVSRGIGTVGVPFRVNCPPEITRILLQPA